MLADRSFPPWPWFDPDEILAVEEVLRSGKVNYWTGTACQVFEEAWSATHGGIHSICMANGSVTLDAALRALGIGPGDEVIVSPRSYVASAMCAVLVGATPVFADVDPDSGCITPSTVEVVRSGRTRAIVAVHVAGWPCDMPALAGWAHRYGIHVIEDCAQGHGAHIQGRRVGTFGVAASWSFCQDKIMSTGGEGGMLCTRDEGVYGRCWSYAQHGKDHDASFDKRSHEVPGAFRWLVALVGTNLRMTEMQAAIGLRQLSKLPLWLERRRRNSLIMQEALRSLPGLRVPVTPEGHAHYRVMAYTEDNGGPQRRNAILRACAEAGVPAMTGSCPEIYRERAFELRGLTPSAMRRGVLDADGRLPTARRLGETSLAFLAHPTIDEATMRTYADTVVRCMQRVDTKAAAGAVG